MPIRIDYSPVGTLMNLARSAGEAQGAREGATHDLAFTQMAMQAQTQNAQIGAAIRRNDQAFQLQRAALARQTRTPTRAAAGPSPVTQEFDRVLGRATAAREWEQEDVTIQMEQLERMRVSGQYSEREIESLKLGIMGGQPLTQLLKEKVPAKPAKPLVSIEQRIRQWRQGWEQQLDPIQKRIDLIVKEQMVPYNVYDDEGDIVPALQEQAEKRQVDLRRKLVALKKHQYNLQTQQQQEWTGLLQGPQAEVRSPDARDTPQSLPSDQSEWEIGQVYRAPDGRIGRWTGRDFERVQ